VTQVETVALWAGLITGVASTVLAVVAIWFTFVVNQRSTQVSDQTVRSLEAIESAVKRQSTDTNDLIRAAWYKMLGSSAEDLGSVLPADAAEEKQLASGLASEVEADLQSAAAESDTAGQDKQVASMLAQINRSLADLQSDMESQLRTQRRRGFGQRIEPLVEELGSVSPGAQELARLLTRPLTRDQHQSLEADAELGNAVRELRREGLLVPLGGVNQPTGRRGPIYWFPPNSARAVRAALMLLPPVDQSTIERVRTALKRAGYPARSEDDREQELVPA
jgi:hypothetical protein